MENLEPKLATNEDAVTIANILTDATQIKVANGDMAWGTEGWTVEEVEAEMQDSSIYVFYDNDVPAATVSLQEEDVKSWGKQPLVALYIHRLAIEGSYSGQGIGAKIIDWSAEKAKVSGKGFLRLDCPAGNEKLCDYYESLGFIKVGENSDTGYDGYVAALYEKKLDD